MFEKIENRKRTYKTDNNRTMCSRSSGMGMRLRSPDIGSQTFIDARYTCDGESRPPRLMWCTEGIPRNAVSLMVIVDDPDAAHHTSDHEQAFTHLAITDISPQTSMLAMTSGTRGARGTVMRNDFGHYGWTGPCPPPCDAPHRYRFTLFAMDMNVHLPAETKLTVEMVQQYLADHILEQSQFFAYYKRSASCEEDSSETP